MKIEFWRGKRVFLTGHTGFKGAWLALWLEHLGAKVYGFAQPPEASPSLFEAADVARGVHSQFGDIRDLELLRKSMTQARPEVVIHMAAQALVRLSYVQPVETYSVNVMGTVHLLEAVRATPSVRGVVIVTSDKCYENREWVWGYREDEAMGGYDPYSNSKGCAELITSAYRRSFFNSPTGGAPTISVGSGRAGNVIGGGDWSKDRLIPDILRGIVAGEPILIRNPHAVRPWQHVLEPLSGYLTLAEKLVLEGASYGEAWNFGPEESDARPVQWIVEQLVAAWGDGARWTRDKAAHPHEAHYLKLDASKARARLDWQPRWGLPQALERIVEWHRGWNAGEDARSLCLAQIQAYMDSPGSRRGAHHE